MATGKPYVFGYYNDANKPFQKALTEHGFDTKGADGIFGKDTRDAVEAAQQFFSISPPDGVPRADLLSFLGLTPPPAPKASNPITDYLTQLAIKALLANLKGRLPMLTGYKTYATAAVIAVMAIYSAIFGDLPLVGHVDLGTAVLALLSSLGLGFARTGAKTEAAKATGQ